MVHLLDGRPLSNANKNTSQTDKVNGYQIFYTGEQDELTVNDVTNPEWVFSFSGQNTGADKDTGPILSLGSYDIGRPIPETSLGKDPIANAYALAGEPPPDEGAMAYWTASIIGGEGITDPVEIQDRMAEHLGFVADNTPEQLEQFGIDNADAVQATLDLVEDITGYSKEDLSQLDKECGHGVKDPLAQSFFVPPGVGIYATKVDLYFGSKDEFLPVSVQIRTMKLGMPTTEIVPFGEVVLDPELLDV